MVNGAERGAGIIAGRLLSAPAELYAYKSVLLSARGSHGRGGVHVSDDELRESIEALMNQKIEVLGLPETEIDKLAASGVFGKPGKGKKQ